MIVRDWRFVPAGALAPVFERERRRWITSLGWDPAEAWGHVEQARTTWGLPGLVALDEHSRIIGSVFYLQLDNRIELGGITADDPAVTCVLLNGVLDAARRAGVEEMSCFAYEGAPGLSLELLRREFTLEPHLYLWRSLTNDDRRVGRTPDVREWHPDDVARVASLLHDAYDPQASRHFTPAHTEAGWGRYVRNLVEQTACGALNAVASRIVERRGRIEAALIVTAVSPTTAHVAQLAVHPEARGRGLAPELLEDAMAIAARQGYEAVSLLVSAANRPARLVYERAGFHDRAAFIAARRPLAEGQRVA